MTRPAIPTTMRTTPTVDRLIPLTDVVTANFSIAPIAINTKLEPILISRSHHGVRGHFKVTLAASYTRLSRAGPAEDV